MIGSLDKTVDLTVGTLTYSALSPSITIYQMLMASIFLSATADTGATNYMGVNGTFDPDPSEGWADQVCRRAGTIKNLEVSIYTAPGAGNSWDFTLRKNGADQTLTCQIAGTDTTGEDKTHEVTVAEGDLVCWKLVPTSSPAAVYGVRITCEFYPS